MFMQNDVIQRPNIIKCVLIFFLLFTISCSVNSPVIKNNKANDIISTANAIVVSLEAQNSQQFAKFVHPQKGVRFSPSTFVDLNLDRVFSHQQIKNFWQDKNEYLWGYKEGSGDSIVLAPAKYLQQYVLIADFKQATSVTIQNDQALGNTANNLRTVYPTATWVEYYIKSTTDDSSSPFDWVALRLVLEKFDGSWFLVGVILDQWSV